jgi:hypothetical protein
MSAVIDMSTIGTVNDPNADNTAALIALSGRVNNEPLEVFFPPGDWHFTGPLPVGTHSDHNVTTSGAFTTGRKLSRRRRRSRQSGVEIGCKIGVYVSSGSRRSTSTATREALTCTC